MPDLRARLRELEGASPPALWERIERGTSTPDPSLDGSTRTARDRVLAGAVGLVIAIAAVALLWPVVVGPRPHIPAPPVEDDLVREASVLVINVRAPEGDERLSAVATYGETTAHFCLDSFVTFGAGGQDEAVDIECEITDPLRVPQGTPVRYVGDFAVVRTIFRHAESTSWFGPAIVPGLGGNRPAKVELQIRAEWSDTGAQLHLDVVPTGPDSLEGRISDALRISCGPDGAHTDTPLVSPTADGIAVEIVDPGSATEIEIRPWYAPFERWRVPAAEGTQVVRPIWGVGEFVVSCAPAPDAGPELIVPGEAFVRTANPNDLFAPYALTCPAKDWVPVGTAEPAAGLGPAEAIRTSIAGIGSGQDVEPAGYHWQDDDAEIWIVPGDGGYVNAYVRYPSLEGYACRGTGIGGA